MIYLRWFEASRMARLAEDWGCSKIKLANIDREIPTTPHRMGHRKGKVWVADESETHQ